MVLLTIMMSFQIATGAPYDLHGDTNLNAHRRSSDDLPWACASSLIVRACAALVPCLPLTAFHAVGFGVSLLTARWRFVCFGVSLFRAALLEWRFGVLAFHFSRGHTHLRANNVMLCW